MRGGVASEHILLGGARSPECDSTIVFAHNRGMAPRVPDRKFQDPVLRQALEDALSAGESTASALARISVSRSTLRREMMRDDEFRSRIERAWLAGGGPQRTSADRSQADRSASAPHAQEDAARPDALAQPAAAVPEAPRVRRSVGSSPIGTGRVVFGSRRPQPLATVRRMALRSPPAWVSERTMPRGERIVPRDWLPAVFVLVADLVLAFVASGNPFTVGLVALVVAAYLIVIRWLTRAAVPALPSAAIREHGRAAPPIVSTAPRLASPPEGAAQTDLAWIKRTIGEPMPERRPEPRTRDRPRG